MEGEEQSKEMEVAPALISVHPLQHSLALALGSDLRIFDLQSGFPISLVDDSPEPFHKDSIRAVTYGAEGKLLVTAGDDKLVKIWKTDTWRCICTVLSEKRVSAVAVSIDGSYVCFADKFGVVWVSDLKGFNDNQALANKKGVPLFAHCCSIITSLTFSPNGRFIVSADRDFKIRITVFPNKPLDGAHEIQSFCLGHTEFVSSLAFLCTSDYPDGFLVSGSGDSTVRLWEITSGSLLDTFEVAVEAGLLHSDGKEEENYPAVTDVCAIPNSSLVVVAIQSFSGIVLLSCSLSEQSLSFSKSISIPGENFIPTSLGISSTAELLWIVTGVSNLQGFNSSTSLARVRAISGLRKVDPETGELEPVVLEDKGIPCGSKLLEKLQGSLSIKDEVFLAAAETLKTAMHHLLIKKQYSTEKREYRKRGRNDRKTKK